MSKGGDGGSTERARASVKEAATKNRSKKPKILRLLEERAASRRIDKQSLPIRAVASDIGGGHLRYGALRFPRTDGAPTIWACVASGAPDHALAAIRSNMWRLRRPSMMISICGLEPGTSTLGPRKERVLISSLARAVRTTSAWVLTPGTRGTAGLLIDRLADEWEDERTPPTCIGLLQWEELDSQLREKLDLHPDGMCFRMVGRARHTPAREQCTLSSRAPEQYTPRSATLRACLFWSSHLPPQLTPPPLPLHLPLRCVP
jgi:hypothetical protein